MQIAPDSRPGPFSFAPSQLDLLAGASLKIGDAGVPVEGSTD